jgi:hypothetical protein
MKKNASKKTTSEHGLLDILDEMRDCCRTITTVAALLETSRNEFLHPQVVPDAGTLIADAVCELKALIETVRKKTP